jgi:two-component system, cell cycle sensor histidine kinase and response regulator CckA
MSRTSSVSAPAVVDVSGAEDFFEMSLDNLCVAGLDGYFKRVNPSWTRTLGWTAEELMSRPSVEFVHPDDRASKLGARQKLQLGSVMGPLINRYLCKDGSFRWFEWRSIAHLDHGLVYAAARDVTEKKLAEQSLAEAAERQAKLERQLMFAERMATVGTLAGGVAHEVNNPLVSVMANISMIIEELDRAPQERSELREMAVDVQEGAERIRNVVRALKTFSRSDDERRAVIDLRPVLKLATDMTSHELRDRARLVKDYVSTPLVDADEARLGQVFVNLLMNAAQALPEGHVDTNEIRIVTMTDAEGRAVVEIRDTGAGIPATLMPRIFDPFFTTKAVGVGTGLGLSICHTIVTGMGGDISATSEPGRGTAIRVVLPAASRAPSYLPALADCRHAGIAFAAILVVDDEPAVGSVLARIFRDHEVTVVTAARKALGLIEGGKTFDVILSDLMMPEMSGIEFYDELAERFPEAARRVIFMSGGAYTARANAFLDRVTNARIDKPFAPSAVRDLVSWHLAAMREA